MIARIRVGWETMIIGPRAEFAGLVDGNPSTADPLSSEYEVRRCLNIALHDPAIANNVRRSFGQWTSDGHRIQEANDRSLIDRVARMTRNGTLIAFVIAEASMKSRRADMNAELPARPEAPDIKVSVDAMTLQQRTVRVLSLTPDFLVGGAREEFMRLLTPETLPLSAGVLSAWAASHVLSIGEIVDAFLFIATVSGGGPSVWASAKTLRRALDLIASATIEKELKDAAQALAQVVTMISVSALAAAIAHEASKRSSKWGARKPSVRKPPEQRAPPPVKLQERPEKASPATPSKKKTFNRTPKELEALASDPAHGGKIDVKSIQERQVGLDLETRGDVPGPITRDPSGKAEFIDATGQKWDVKGFNSNFPPKKGGFDLTRDANKIDASLAQGENVMLDTSKMSPQNIQALQTEGARRGWGERVKSWP